MELTIAIVIAVAALLIVFDITGTITGLAKIKAGKLSADDKAEIIAEVKRQVLEEQRSATVPLDYTQPQNYASPATVQVERKL